MASEHSNHLLRHDFGEPATLLLANVAHHLSVWITGEYKAWVGSRVAVVDSRVSLGGGQPPPTYSGIRQVLLTPIPVRFFHPTIPNLKLCTFSGEECRPLPRLSTLSHH